MTRTTPEVSRARATYSKNRRAYEAALRSFSGRVRTLLAKEGLAPIISHRVKEFDSYLTKVARLRKARAPILLHDFFGARVVCPFLDETERVQELLAKHFHVVEIERKGADRPLAEFGYESVHLLVRLPQRALPTIPPHTKRLCEIQVCTILQHAWAQIEHELVYKADRSVPKSAIRRKLAAVSATLTLADVVFQETRDNLTDLHERGVRRRESAHRVGAEDEIEPLATTPREVTLLARRDRTLPDRKRRDLENLIVEALRAHSSGELEEAIQIYGDVLRLRLPNRTIRSMIYNHRGIAHLTLSRPDRAIRDFTSAVRWNGENFRAHFNFGLANRALGKPTTALCAFRRALAGHEVAGEAHYAIAHVLAEMGRRREARAACDRALALRPNFESAKSLREALKKAQGRPGPARVSTKKEGGS
jgi:putative GTP pyrophosphokinase